jgi:hypothetical protein
MNSLGGVVGVKGPLLIGRPHQASLDGEPPAPVAFAQFRELHLDAPRGSALDPLHHRRERQMWRGRQEQHFRIGGAGSAGQSGHPTKMVGRPVRS